MSGDRSALSQTLSGLKGKCDSCPAISRLAIIVDNTRDDVTTLQEANLSTRDDLAHIRGILSQLPAQLADLKDSTRHEIKAAMRVAVMSAGGADPDKTPRGRSSGSSELKLPGGVSWRGPTTVLAMLLVFAAMVAAGAYVAAQWGPPGKTATAPAKAP